MKKIIITLLIIVFFPVNCFAMHDSARSSVVMDVESGRILYSKNMNEKRLIASITKIMTCVIVLENTSLNDTVKVGEEVLKMYGTNIYLELGEEITVKDLLYGLMLRSGNDAAVVLATFVAGSEEKFVQMMNNKAIELGMNNTSFENSHGLDEETKNYSTAYDMSLLSKYAYKNKIYRKIINTKKYVTKSKLKSYIWYNRMSLLGSYEYCIGGKNGYTPKAGKTLVSISKKNGLILTAVSLDDSDIYENHKNLYNNMFDKYSNYKIINKDSFKIGNYFINDDVYVKQSFYYPLSSDEIDNIYTFFKYENVNKNNKVGEIVVTLNNDEIRKINVYKKNKKNKKN